MTVTSTLRLLLTAHVVNRASGIGSPRCGQAAGSTMECCRAGWALRWGWRGHCWLLSRVMKMISTRMVWESAGQRLTPLYCWVRTFFHRTFLGKKNWICILIILVSCFFTLDCHLSYSRCWWSFICIWGTWYKSLWWDGGEIWGTLRRRGHYWLLRCAWYTESFLLSQ